MDTPIFDAVIDELKIDPKGKAYQAATLAIFVWPVPSAGPVPKRKPRVRRAPSVK